MLPIFYAILSALLFALTFLFRKYAVNFISTQLAFLIEAVVYLFLAFLIFLTYFITSKKEIELNWNGLIYAGLAGIFVVLGVVFNYLALRSGFLSKIVSIMSPSQIIFGVLLGILLLKENLTIIQLLGVFLSVIGVILISSNI